MRVEKEVTSVISGSLPGTESLGTAPACLPPRHPRGWWELTCTEGYAGSCGGSGLWEVTEGVRLAQGEAFAPLAQIHEKVQREGGCWTSKGSPKK